MVQAGMSGSLLLAALLLLLLLSEGECVPVTTARSRLRMENAKYTLLKPLGGKRRVPAPVTGQLKEANADIMGRPAPTAAGSIIVVPKFRVASGCRLYQRADPRGRCRDRW